MLCLMFVLYMSFTVTQPCSLSFTPLFNHECKIMIYIERYICLLYLPAHLGTVNGGQMSGSEGRRVSIVPD